MWSSWRAVERVWGKGSYLGTGSQTGVEQAGDQFAITLSPALERSCLGPHRNVLILSEGMVTMSKDLSHGSASYKFYQTGRSSFQPTDGWRSNHIQSRAKFFAPLTVSGSTLMSPVSLGEPLLPCFLVVPSSCYSSHPSSISFASCRLWSLLFI